MSMYMKKLLDEIVDGRIQNEEERIKDIYERRYEIFYSRSMNEIEYELKEFIAPVIKEAICKRYIFIMKRILEVGVEFYSQPNFNNRPFTLFCRYFEDYLNLAAESRIGEAIMAIRKIIEIDILEILSKDRSKKRGLYINITKGVEITTKRRDIEIAKLLSDIPYTEYKDYAIENIGAYDIEMLELFTNNYDLNIAEVLYLKNYEFGTEYIERYLSKYGEHIGKAKDWNVQQYYLWFVDFLALR